MKTERLNNLIFDINIFLYKMNKTILCEETQFLSKVTDKKYET